MEEKKLTETIYSHCRNCGNEVRENYCGNCGQSIKKGGRINSRYILDEAQHSVLHVDRGIFYTLKELLIRPGKMINNYLSGKRVDYFKPLAIVVLFAGLYGFIVYFFNIIPEAAIAGNIEGTEEFIERYQKMTVLIYKNYSLFMVLFTPVIALSVFLVFRKSGYNYLENLVICCYIAAMQTLIMLVLYPFYFYFSPALIFSLNAFLGYFYYIWVLYQLFHRTSSLKTLFKTIVSLVLGIVFIALISFIVATCYYVFTEIVL